MAQILDGKKLSEKILGELTEEISAMDKVPNLAVVLVGDDPASEIYVRNKQKAAAKVGIKSELVRYPQDIDQTSLIEKIKELNNNDEISAILVQLPLPYHIDVQEVVKNISPRKDADGFTVENFGRLALGLEPYAYPCTPQGIIFMLNEHKISVSGKHVVIVGRSNIVGKPLAQMMLNANATVTICHSRTTNLEEITKTADILISAVGKKIITANMVKPNAVVIDVGITRDANGKVSGDVYFNEVSQIASYISPTPGGVGPMTITSLLYNTLKLFKNSL